LELGDGVEIMWIVYGHVCLSIHY